MRFTPGTHVGPYEILGLLGQGGMGEVYRARDPRLGRDVAVKTIGSGLSLDAEQTRRFEREARAAGTLNHPNILTVFDVGTLDGTPYLVAELLQGRSLRERLRAGRVSPREAVDLGIQLASGLAAAHARGIVHRDLKPENLILTEDGMLKILDFGIAKLVRASSVTQVTSTQPSDSTGSGIVLGTARYMAPEQLRGEAVDHRADLFAVGCILYEMLAGTHPFERDNPVETSAAILGSEAPDLPDGTLMGVGGLDPVIRKCLAKRVADRLQSAADLAFFLEHLSASPSSVESSRSDWVGAAPVMRQLSFRRGTTQSARFAPDGSSAVYGAAWEGKAVELFWVHVANPESRPLHMERTDVLSISGSGEMAVLMNRRYLGGFVWAGTLGKLPLAGGVPRPLAEDVMAAEWSPDGRILAILRWKDGKVRLEHPAGNILYETLGWIDSPRFSPDGEQIAFIDHELNWDDAGYVSTVGRDGTVRRVTDHWASSQGLAWAPNGDILFTAAKVGARRALHRLTPDGSVRTLVQFPGSLTLFDLSKGNALLSHGIVRSGILAKPPGEDRERDLSWFDWSIARAISADGSVTLFDESGEAGGAARQVYLRPTDGSPAFKIGEGIALDLSPDGAWALTVSLSDLSQLVLAPTGIGEPRVIRLGEVSCHAACLFPDGRRIAVIGSEQGAELGLYVFDIDTGERAMLASSGLVAASPLASPDGRSVLAMSRDRVLRLYPVDGGEPREFRGVGKRETAMSWSANGTELFVIEPGEVPTRVHQVDLATGERRLWKELKPLDATGIERVNRIRIATHADAYAYTYYMLLNDLYVLEGVDP